ncbi:hypothetical protein, partial [Enterococcus faecalis]|uniref:hypothetical protein n=1 Tax=Enterococcus faecalis TaxID=1351 RepID=UPI0013E8C3B2
HPIRMIAARTADQIRTRTTTVPTPILITTVPVLIQRITTTIIQEMAQILTRTTMTPITDLTMDQTLIRITTDPTTVLALTRTTMDPITVPVLTPITAARTMAQVLIRITAVPTMVLATTRMTVLEIITE